MRTRVFSISPRAPMVKFFFLLLGMAPLALTGCQAPWSTAEMGQKITVAPTSSVGAELRRRPLQFPTVTPGGACPASSLHTINAGVGSGLGNGPVYLSFGERDVFMFAPASNFSSDEWGGDKVIWATRPEYQGYVLARGQQLDGADRVGFGRGDVPSDEYFFRPESDPNFNDGWVYDTNYLRFRAPGCYAIQIDGTNFSSVVVFQAEPK